MNVRINNPYARSAREPSNRPTTGTKIVTWTIADEKQLNLGIVTKQVIRQPSDKNYQIVAVTLQNGRKYTYKELYD